MSAMRLVLAALVVLATMGRGSGQSKCNGNKCPDVSTCELVQGAPVCVCPKDKYSRLLDGKCTTKPLKRWGYLDPHNAARAAVGSVPLVWDDKLAADAQDWADILANAQLCGLKLQTGVTYGQNVANFFRDRDFRNDDAVNMWVAQGGNYTYSRFSTQGAAGCKTGNWRGCAAYTQVIWNNTRRIGCGVGRCPGLQAKVWVCNYSPAGNKRRQFPYRK